MTKTAWFLRRFCLPGCRPRPDLLGFAVSVATTFVKTASRFPPSRFHLSVLKLPRARSIRRSLRCVVWSLRAPVDCGPTEPPDRLPACVRTPTR